MFRKILLALAATATIGGAAITPASAGYYGHNSYGYGFYTPSYYSYGYRSHCYTKKIWVDTYYGPVAKWVKVCN
jgi:hypothetical protein